MTPSNPKSTRYLSVSFCVDVWHCALVLGNMHTAKQEHTLSSLREGRGEWVCALQCAFLQESCTLLLGLAVINKGWFYFFIFFLWWVFPPPHSGPRTGVMLCFSHIQPYEPFVIKNPKTSWACYGMFIDPRKTPLTLLSQFHPLLGSIYPMGSENYGAILWLWQLLQKMS